MHELARAAGAAPLALVSASRQAPSARYFIGSGKAEALRETLVGLGAELVIFDHSLTPAQERNLERLLGCRVVDRTGLILDIFAQRASSFEGKLQVELAQLRHLSTRLVRGWSHLERQKGGIGLRGPGESQLETDRRLVSVRIRQISRRLESVAQRRALSRRARQRSSIPVVTLIGYTNVGKSTLFNALTGAGVGCADQLFATLDPTLRRVALPGGAAAVLADTVGFVRHLPHELVAAFRATLEELARSSLLLHVIDASDPDAPRKAEQVEAVLESIDAAAVPRIEVLNKIDRCGDADGPGSQDWNGSGGGSGSAVCRVRVSARTGEGIEELLATLGERLGRGRTRERLRLPPQAGRLRALLYELGTVLSEETLPGGESNIEVELLERVHRRLCREEGLVRFREAPAVLASTG